MKEHNNKKSELDKITNSKINHLWLQELDNLKIVYNEFILETKEETNETKKTKKKF